MCRGVCIVHAHGRMRRRCACQNVSGLQNPGGAFSCLSRSTGCTALALLQATIGASRAAAFDLTAACSGFVMGLVTGAQYIRAGSYKTVLVIGAPRCGRASTAGVPGVVRGVRGGAWPATVKEVCGRG